MAARSGWWSERRLRLILAPRKCAWSRAGEGAPLQSGFAELRWALAHGGEFSVEHASGVRAELLRRSD